MNKMFILFFILKMSLLQAQVINTTYTYRDINGNRYIRYLYENDFFTATDELYTQGINLEYTSPKQKNFLTSRLLVSPSNYSSTYKIGLQHNAYTPQSIQDPSIRLNDRPYAAALILQFSNTALHATKKIRISSSLSMGVLGYIAGGEWMQKTIHRNLDNVAPQGWQYQIANDIAINYRLQIENKIISIGDILLLNTTTGIDVGTLLNRISAGGNLVLGFFNSPYKDKDGTYSISIFAHPQVHAIGYDATLQGGVFTKSPHTFTSSEIERLVYSNRYGINIQIHKLYLEYFYQNRSKNFKQGKAHKWGGLAIGLVF
jgi:hypothetical protein